MKYHFKQVVFLATAVLFFGLGVIMPQGGFGGPEVYKNGPYVINFIVCILSIFLIFVSALFCANAVLRDKSHQMEAFVFSSGVSKRTYLGVKFAGLLLSVSLIICIAVAGIFAGSLLLPASQKGNFQLLYYVQPLLLFALPNALFCSSLISAAAVWKQNTSIVYVAAVLLFILYFTASILGNSPVMANSVLKPGGPGLFSVLVDPFGLTTFFGETKSWPLSRRNHDLYPLRGTFLANRLLWLVIALLVVTLSYRQFQFRLASMKLVHKPRVTADVWNTITYRPLAVATSGLRYVVTVFTSQLRLEVSFLIRQQQFLILVALWVFVYAVELNENIFHGQYGVRFYPTTALVVEQLLPVRLALLLLVFYASELLHREQATRMQALVFSTPVRNSILFLAKTAALVTLILVLISASITTGIGLQLSSGYRDISVPAYISLFYYSGFPLLLFAVLIIFIQTIIPNKYLGMLLSLVVLGISIFGKILGIDTYLLRFGSTPELTYSAINGFGHYARAFHGYMFFWTCIACLLGMLTSRWWPTGRQDTWRRRIAAGLKNWNQVSRIGTAFLALMIFCAGYFIFKKSDGIAIGKNRKIDIQWQKHYEQKYVRHAALMQPSITAVKIKTDIFPEQQRYAVSGAYTLRNESGSPISELWIGVDPTVTRVDLQITGAIAKRFDEYHKQYFYELEKPLLPGSKMSVGFSMQVDRSGYLTFDSENSVESNGSYIELEKFLPFFGYNDGYELDDPQVRNKNGLSPKTIPVENDHRYHLIDFENTISTNADQQVVTVGSLSKSWEKGGRRYFQYKTAQPIAFMFAISSARYEVETQMRDGVTFQVYYHAGQKQNVTAMMKAMQDGIGYGSSQFSTYPLKQITLAEIPAYEGAATAYPGVIFSHEKYNFLVDSRDSSRLNFSYATTAHETAHQWWGNKIRPQAGAGEALLTETLAKYTEAMVIEKHLGKARLRPYLQTDNELYFSLRNLSGRKELPLNKTWEQPYVYYQKGGLAMYALKNRLGEKQVNAALKKLIGDYSSPNLKPSANELVKELNRNATVSEQTLVENYLEKVMVCDHSIRIVSSDVMKDGRYRVRLLVSIKKTDETNARPSNAKIDDRIEIAVYRAAAKSAKQQMEPIYFRKHHFVKAQTMIEVLLNEKPEKAVVGPDGYLLDENPNNNSFNSD